MSKKEWRRAIEKALRDKGFCKKAARKTAIKTMNRSIQCRARDRKQVAPIVNSEPTVRHGAIYQKSSMVEKVVVVPPAAK